jgi:hypothetical protein
VTLCIAAACQDWDTKRAHFVFCADRKSGTPVAQAEISFKMRWIKYNWPAMIAGDLSRAEELICTFKDHLRGIDFQSANVFDSMREAGESFRRKLVDELVQKKLSVSYDYLRQNRSKFPAATVYEVYSTIGQTDSEVEMITAGILEDQVLIFVMDRSCSVSNREHFAAIGTGAPIAEPALYQRKQQKFLPVPDTIYRVYEAKKLGEIADAVGTKTDTIDHVLLENGEMEIKRITTEGYTFLDSKYKELGLSPIPDMVFEGNFFHALGG